MRPAARTQQPAEPTANAGFGGLRLRGQFQALGLVLRSVFHETPMNTRIYRVSFLWVGLKKGGLNKWNKQTVQKI